MQSGYVLWDSENLKVLSISEDKKGESRLTSADFNVGQARNSPETPQMAKFPLVSVNKLLKGLV